MMLRSYDHDVRTVAAAAAAAERLVVVQLGVRQWREVREVD